MRAALLLLATIAIACAACADGGGVGASDGGGDGGGGADAEGGSGAGPITNGSGGHGCFDTEATCDGACVDVLTNSQHCGMCDHPCDGGANQSGQCIDGECASQCEAGFVEDQGGCKNFFGAHEAYPAECAACNQANPYSGGCSCPLWATDLALAVQSDCPGVPMRFATELRLCVTEGVSNEIDFGGAYQVDDFAGLCGATAQCRKGNPLAGNTCACPAGFDEAISMRSIIRLPCDGTEVGSTIVLCGNKDASLIAFGGAYQFDDFEPQCRVSNPWTGACSCPTDTTDNVYRVMVDGAAGLYGSTLHICSK